MNDFFTDLITKLDLDQTTPIEQTYEFQTVCNYFYLSKPHDRLEFVQRLDGLTLNDVLEQIFYKNLPLFEKIERRGKSEIKRLQLIFDEARTLLYEFIKEVCYAPTIQ